MRKAIGAVCITVLCAALLTGCSNTAGSVSESLNEENSSSSQQSYSEEISDNESNDLIAEAEEALEQGRYEEAVEKSVKGYLMKEDSTGFETITLRVAEKLAEEQGFDNPMASKEETFDKKYYEIAIKCDSFKGKDIGTLSEEQLMFDAEVFKAFGRVFILTYLSDGCVLTSYLNINHIKYGYYHVEQTDTGHQFKEGFRPTTPEQKQRIKSLLNIYEGPLNTNYLTKKELNSTAKADSALSKSWFDSKKSKIAKKSIEQLKNNAVNYISHIRGAYKNECLWSTFKQYANKFDCPRLKYRCVKRDSKKGNGCLDCQSRNSCRVNFLACNCRATNKFKDKTVLIYLLNIYPSPIISDYLATKGYPLDADTYALAQLLQWIWRSAIREDKPVYLYLPSSRLRKLLYQYLNDED